METIEDNVKGIELCIIGILPFGVEYNEDLVVDRIKVSFSVTMNHKVYKFSCSSSPTYGEIVEYIREFMNLFY